MRLCAVGVAELGGQLRPRTHPQLGVNVRQMKLHRLDTDEQLRRHLTITHPHRHQPRHRQLLRGQPRRIKHTPLRRRQPTRRQLLLTPLHKRPRPQPHQQLTRHRQPLRRRPPPTHPPQHLPPPHPRPRPGTRRRPPPPPPRRPTHARRRPPPPPPRTRRPTPRPRRPTRPERPSP